MPFCSFDAESAMFDSTPIENMFLLEYLPVAQEDALRVYLYARMLCQHPELGDSIEDMARALRLEEENVREAFQYWEREGLVKRLSDRPVTYAVLTMRGMSCPEPMEQQYYAFRDFNADLQKLFGANLIHGEIRIAQEWVTTLKFSKDAALRLVDYGLSRLKYSKTSVRGTLKKLDKIAFEWAERGVRTLEDVERMIAYEDGNYKAAEAVLRRFSLRRRPTRDELMLADKWINDWHFTVDDLIDACSATVKAQNPSFGYLDKVLESRREGKNALWEPLRQTLRQLGCATLPTPQMRKRYAEFLDAGFAPRTIELAAIQQSGKNKHQFEDLERLLEKWAEFNLYSPDAAEAYVARQRMLSREVSEILKLAGSDRRPRLEDNALLENLKTRFSDELIRFAAELSRDKGRPLYMIDRLLADWEKSGVKTVEQARAHVPARAKTTENPALQYQQRTYNESLFSEGFFTNIPDAKGEAK